MYFYWNIIKTSAGIIRTKNMQAVFVGTVEEIPLINPDNCKNKERVMSVLSLKNVRKEYHTGSLTVTAVEDVSFDLNEGELVVILGESGAGKTTLLNLLGGMDTATSGEIDLDGENIAAFNKKQLTDYRRHDVGFVFQFYNLMPNLTALENVEIAVEICDNHLDPKTVLESVGLSDRLNNFPAELSGGEQQRVSIARAIAKNPKLILCDEPTGALDYITGKKILKILQDLSRERQKLVIVVTHNAALKDMADKVIRIKSGRIESIETNDNPKAIEEIEW
jgi:putative ABC transport system ATP-binding protein